MGILPATTDKHERDMIAQAQAGNRRAFGELVTRHRAGVVNVVYRMCGDLQVAEDAAQDAFVRAWQKLPEYQPRAPFRNWLYRIATNVALDSLRRQKKTVDVDALPLATRTHGPEGSYEVKERAKQVQAAVMALPESSRAALILREYEGLSYAEIANTLNIPVGTVMSRLNYARKQLLKRLENVL